MKYNGPKVRLSRRLGIALTPKAERVMEGKPYPPGEHGQRRGRRTSVYQQQLREKQRLRMQYNISERQLRICVKRATRQSGNTVDRLAQQLETRLDSLVLRAGMARTIYGLGSK
jgi:small subunit ribosomal protein S4